MSVPLDRLYNHLDGLCNHDALIYRFAPHGSKKLEDLQELYDYHEVDWFSCITRPNMICHDQEPLNFKFYGKSQVIDAISPAPASTLEKFNKWFENMNIRSILSNRHSLYDITMLVHSEKNSIDLEQYEQAGFAGVYWWAHAAIAADWYRYAQHDLKLAVDFDKIDCDFLIYNRAWSGTREYRLKFTELVVNAELQSHCLMKFTPECNNTNYKDFYASNPALAISNYNLENYFDPADADANASADYNNLDYQRTAIEVVLETLFDDTRLHLTEKALRPIACGRPFMLAATPGSLEYLRSYGFETFDGVIDESYDTIIDPVQRLTCICKEMQRISLLPQQQKQNLWHKLYQISKRNQQLFFSDAWQQSIFDEFTHNYNSTRTAIDKQVSTANWETLKEVNFDLCPTSKMLQHLKVSLDNHTQIQAWIDDH
jgi:hypothetical protein